MKHFTITLEDELIILNHYKLNPNEMMFIKVLLIMQDDNTEQYFKDYLKVLKDSNINLRDLIITLQNKEIILKSYKTPKEGQSFDPYAIPINKNFLKNLYKSSFELGKELFEAYPQFGLIGGNYVPLRTVAKKFDSLEQAYFKYGKSIGWNPEKHKDIIELVNWAKENNVLNMSLCAFIINQTWLDLEALKNGDTVNINYDAIKMV